LFSTQEYSFLRMVYYYIYHNSGHYPSSCPLLKKHNISETEFSLRLKVEPTQPGPIALVVILCYFGFINGIVVISVSDDRD
jgi:hypothetical protein